MALRVAAEVAYSPGLFFGGDSAQYLKLAFEGDPVGLAYERPSGYPLLIRGLAELGSPILLVTGLQHVAGIAAGLLAYTLMRRLEVPRPLALAGAGLLMLDAYAIALEQHVLADSLFAFLLLASAFLAVGADRGPGALALSGLLLGSAATLRTAALFAVPVWIAYLLIAHRRPALLAAALVALLLPVVGYAAWHESETGRFGFTRATGWFLYGRIGEIGECGNADVPRGARALCNRNANDAREGPAYHLWHADGTAHRAFGSLTAGGPERQERLESLMGDYAVAIIADRPLRYVGLVAEDMIGYFTPGRRAGYISDDALRFPERHELTPLLERVRRPHFPDLEQHLRAPSGALRAYGAVVHTPRWLLGPLVLAALLALVLRLLPRTRGRVRHAPEILLLAGIGLTLLVGVTATSNFSVRYLLPVFPLLLVAGLAGAVQVLRARSATMAAGPGYPGSVWSQRTPTTTPKESTSSV